MNRVLIIEDDPGLADIRLWEKTCRREVKQGLYGFDLATSGEAALQKVTDDVLGQGEIKVLVVDLRMDNVRIDGFEFLREIVRHDWQDRFAIIIFTALPSEAVALVKALSLNDVLILGKGTPDEQIKHFRGLFNQAMLNNDSNVVTMDLSLIEAGIRAIDDPKDLDYIRRICKQLGAKRKEGINAIKQRHIKAWIRKCQSQGYLKAVPVAEDIDLQVIAHRSTLKTGKKTYYKVSWHFAAEPHSVGVPVAIAESLMEVLANMDEEIALFLDSLQSA